MAKKKLTLEDMLVPVDEIPYEVPENWCWVKLGSVINVSSGKNLTKSKMNNNGNIPVYGGNGFVGYHDEFNIEESKIIIGRVGANCGNVHITDNKGWITDNAFIVSYDKNLFNQEYLYYLLSECDLGKYNSSSAQPVISGQKIYDVPIQIPPLAEQERIVNRIESLFDKVDRAVELVDEARDGFERRRAAILERAFSGELTKKWREENGVSDEWNKVKLSDICDIIMGQSPKGSSYNDIGEGIPLVNGPVEFGPTHFSKTRKIKWTTEPTKMCKEGDLLLCVRGSLGKINIAGFEACIGRGVASIRAKEGISQMYINYKIHSMKNEINSLGTGTTFLNISSKQIKDIEIGIPSLDEQIALVSILDKLLDSEYSIEEVSDISENIEVIKKSILVKAFRGELGSNNLNEKSSIELLKELIK